MIEILPETPVLRGGNEIDVGGSENPEVHHLALGAAEAAHGSFLDHFQELALERQGQEAHLVQQQRPAPSCLEQAGLGLPGIGECSALDAEELGLEQRLRNGRTVDVHERAHGTLARPMNRPCEKTLTGACLTQEKKGGKPAPTPLTAEQMGYLSAQVGDGDALPDQLRKNSGNLG